MFPRVPFLVPSIVALSLMTFLVSTLGPSLTVGLSGGCVVLGYCIVLFTIAKSTAGWFRNVVSISLSFVLASPLAAGLAAAYDRENLTMTVEMVFLLPITVLAVALSIRIIERCLFEDRRHAQPNRDQ
jgi:hypothetical protein